MLKDAENLARMWEDTDARLERERLPDQKDWISPEKACGTTQIHSNELIRRIKKMNADLWVEDSTLSKERAGFYYLDPMTQKRAFTGAHWQKGMIRERVLVYVDRSDRATGYELGWREILHRLLRKKLITWQQVKLHFPVHENQLSGPFDRQVRDLKN